MTETATPKRTEITEDEDVCRECGSDSLYSGYFDADDLATDDDSKLGTRWTTWCNDCGAET